MSRLSVLLVLAVAVLACSLCAVSAASVSPARASSASALRLSQRLQLDPRYERTLPPPNAAVFDCQVKDLIPGQGGVGRVQVEGALQRAATQQVQDPVTKQTYPAGYTSPDGKFVKGVYTQRPIAVVKAPGGGLHVTDAHHHLASLVALGVQNAKCALWGDFSSMNQAEYKKTMVQKGWIYSKKASGASTNSKRLPGSAAKVAASDDPWRSVAGQINYALPKDKPCFDLQGKTVPYAEFMWGSYFRKALAGNVADYASFNKITDETARKQKQAEWVKSTIEKAKSLCQLPGASRLPGYRALTKADRRAAVDAARDPKRAAKLAARGQK